jgi:hypothetical protein
MCLFSVRQELTFLKLLGENILLNSLMSWSWIGMGFQSILELNEV